MSTTEALALLRRAVAEASQAAVARELGYSPSTVNQVLKGVYCGAQGAVLRRVVEVYGAEKVTCPVLGEIALKRCAEERRRPFAATNPMRVQLWKACRACPKGGSKC